MREPLTVCAVCDSNIYTAESGELHYLGHIAQDLKSFAEAQQTQLAELRAISSSGFLNPRGPGETPDDVQQRIERRRHPARG